MIHVFTEGSKTEPLYLKALAERLNLTGVRFRVTPAPSPDPLRLLSLAVKEAVGMAPASCWLVLDVESGADPVRRRHLASALSGARDAGIRVALSNPSFEFWLLLHERDSRQPFSSPRHALQVLSRFCPGFTKASPPLQRWTGSDAWRAASRRAIAGRNRHGIDAAADSVIRANPSTNVDRLIAAMLEEAEQAGPE